jgi:hypothetical protein
MSTSGNVSSVAGSLRPGFFAGEMLTCKRLE